MPIRKQDYPTDWKDISLQVRAEAGNRCEWCGAHNKSVIRRYSKNEKVKAPKKYPGLDWIQYTSILETDGRVMRPEDMSWARLRFHGLTKIILTVAHLDRDSTNNARENLAALCQRCHLRHDIHQHLASRKYGRHHTKHQQKKLEL
jgi:5-methylcytosine-specific restriction endonuclease McrA